MTSSNEAVQSIAAFLPIIVDPKPNPIPNKSHRGKNTVGLIFLF